MKCKQQAVTCIITSGPDSQSPGQCGERGAKKASWMNECFKALRPSSKRRPLRCMSQSNGDSPAKEMNLCSQVRKQSCRGESKKNWPLATEYYESINPDWMPCKCSRLLHPSARNCIHSLWRCLQYAIKARLSLQCSHTCGISWYTAAFGHRWWGWLGEATEVRLGGSTWVARACVTTRSKFKPFCWILVGGFNVGCKTKLIYNWMNWMYNL